jgi:hypothetical protein
LSVCGFGFWCTVPTDRRHRARQKLATNAAKTEKKKMMVVAMREEKKQDEGVPNLGGRRLTGDTDGDALLYKQWVGAKEAATRLYPFGLRHNRLLWACGDPGMHHGFRGVAVDIMPWPPVLKAIRDRLVVQFGVYTNFCLVNHYRDGRDAIAPHADEELYARNKSVFTLALGATRPMKLVPSGRSSSKRKTAAFPFQSGDLFLMCGQIQKHWKHGIDVDLSLRDVRFSLTFRSTSLHSGVVVAAPRSGGAVKSGESSQKSVAVRRVAPADGVPVSPKPTPVLGVRKPLAVPPLRLPPFVLPASTPKSTSSLSSLSSTSVVRNAPLALYAYTHIFDHETQICFTSRRREKKRKPKRKAPS